MLEEAESMLVSARVTKAAKTVKGAGRAKAAAAKLIVGKESPVSAAHLALSAEALRIDWCR